MKLIVQLIIQNIKKAPKIFRRFRDLGKSVRTKAILHALKEY